MPDPLQPVARFACRRAEKDTTAQKITEIRVARLKDFYAALSEVNNAIIRAQDRNWDFAEVCKAIVQHGRLQFVRLAMLDPSNRQLRTLVHSSDDHGLSTRFYCRGIRTSRKAGRRRRGRCAKARMQ